MRASFGVASRLLTFFFPPPFFPAVAKTILLSIMMANSIEVFRRGIFLPFSFANVFSRPPYFLERVSVSDSDILWAIITAIWYGGGREESKKKT